MTPATDHLEVLKATQDHLSRFWARHQQEEFVFSHGPILQRFPHFRVRRIAPRKAEDPWVYVTAGTAAEGPDEHHGLEFVLLAPSEDPLHVELLAMVANLHGDSRFRLSVGSVVAIGRPWAEGAHADHLLVSLPYPFGPELEHLTVGPLHIRFLWLVPITHEEAEEARASGSDALEAMLHAGSVDVVDVNRRSMT